MSRVLAQLLGANEVLFRQQIQRLERTAGLPSTDIRLAVHIAQATRQKLSELGLDPTDTTGRELYAALQTKLRGDEVYMRASLNLRADIQLDDLLERVANCLSQLDLQSELFAIKPAVLKQIIKKLKPKATMKRLGYRSMDSMIKHETAPQLLAACLATESADWQEARLTAYGKLQVKDFESRPAQFIVPSGKKWPKLAEDYVAQHKNNLMEIPELGAIIIMPISRDLPGLVITILVTALHALNDMRAFSFYLKLQQVRPDFGKIVESSIREDPMTELELGGSQLSWKAVHWFYGHGHVGFYADIFEPHIQPEDLVWHRVGASLARLQPVLAFWEDTEMLGLLDDRDAVSLNVLDVALGLCNGFGYAERVVQHMRERLGRELLAQYLQQDYLQGVLRTTIGRHLAPQLDLDNT